MTPAEIRARLRESARIIRLLPYPQLVIGYPRASIPEPVEESWGSEWEAAGVYDAKEKRSAELRLRDTPVKPVQPMGQEIDLAWEAFGWLGYLRKRDQWIVWGWANGHGAWNAASKYHRSERTIERWIELAIDRIAAGLKKKDYVVDAHVAVRVVFAPTVGALRLTAHQT